MRGRLFIHLDTKYQRAMLPSSLNIKSDTMEQTKVLLTGATGYVGGAVLSALLTSSNPAIQALSITTPVRRKEQFEVLEALGVHPVIFRDLDDVDFLSERASEHDVVIHTASGFHLASAMALVGGLGLRRRSTERDVHYIHTSGTWNLEKPSPDYEGTDIDEFSDKNDIYGYLKEAEAQKSVSQRKTLLEVVAKSESEDVQSYCFLPPDIYGLSPGPFNRQPLYLSEIITGSLNRGHPEYVGKGNGGVGHVHITDLAALYELIVGRILAGNPVPSAHKRLLFTETLYHNWSDVSRMIGEIGVREGIWETAQPVSLPIEDAARDWPAWDMGSIKTSFCLRNKTTPDLALELGWKPEKTESDWRASVEEIFRIIVNKRE
ncbi:hypothetical protein BGZ63DRAFT_391697 [Mariannaea sp. PMI_226]|nr:hypothetical protein BGZ63DRAFT_391697 [Mariannaea sp. PMI_226]